MSDSTSTVKYSMVSTGVRYQVISVA